MNAGIRRRKPPLTSRAGATLPLRACNEILTLCNKSSPLGFARQQGDWAYHGTSGSTWYLGYGVWAMVSGLSGLWCLGYGVWVLASDPW